MPTYVYVPDFLSVSQRTKSFNNIERYLNGNRRVAIQLRFPYSLLMLCSCCIANSMQETIYTIDDIHRYGFENIVVEVTPAPPEGFKVYK